MSTGRPDYNSKVVPVAEVIGDDEEQYSYIEYFAISYGVSYKMFDLTLPSTYDLYISHIIMSASDPGLQQFIMFKAGESIFNYWWDTNDKLNFSGSSIMKFDSNTQYQIYLKNLSSTSCNFTLMLRGYKRLI